MREYLEASATDLDLPTELQGAGLPNVERALSDTYWRQIAARRVGESHAEVARNVRSLRASLKAQRKEIQELIGSLR